MNLGILRKFEGQVNSGEYNHPLKVRNAYVYTMLIITKNLSKYGFVYSAAYTSLITCPINVYEPCPLLNQNNIACYHSIIPTMLLNDR